MKKVLIIGLILIAALVGAGVYFLSGAGDFIKAEIEKYGSEYLDTQVSVGSVDLALSDGRLTILGTKIKNPEGFSNDNAFSLNEITLDIGNISAEPYTVQTIKVDAPEVLYEVDASGKGNLLVLKDSLTAKLPEPGEPTPPTTEGTGPGPLVIVESVMVSNVKLRLNFEALNTDALDVELETKSYDVTLPTFNAGSIGKPDGIPAEQVGGAIAKIMLDNIIAAAKKEAKSRLEDAAKEKLKEEGDKLKEKAKEKAKEKLKGLFN